MMNEIQKISREIIYNKALRLLGRQEYSVWGLTKKLREKFPNDFAIISDIVEEFIKKDWLSDDRFSDFMVREKAQYSGWGERKIIMKLNEHKICTELIQEKLAKYFSQDVQLKKAQKLAEEKLQRLEISRKKLTNYEKQQKIKLFLVSRGFSFEMAQSAVEYLRE